MLSYSLKMKAPSSIYFLGLAKNPRDRTTMVSLDTTPHLTVRQHSHFGSPLFRVLCNVSSLDPINTKILPPPSISHLQLHSQYYSYDPFPMSEFHLLPGLPCCHTLNKGSLRPPYSLAPFPPFSVLVP